MAPSDIARRLRLERNWLESTEGPLSEAGVKALCARLADMEAALLALLSVVPNNGALEHRLQSPMHPWQAWVYSPSRESIPRSLAEAAASLRANGVNVSDERVKSWVKSKDRGGRRIPFDIAQQIERLWGYKATEANWPNGFLSTSRKRAGTATRSDIGKQFSEARGGASGLTEAAHAAGHSLRSLGEECGVSHSYLSQLANGGRPVSPDLAAMVKSITGWDEWPRRKPPPR